MAPSWCAVGAENGSPFWHAADGTDGCPFYDAVGAVCESPFYDAADVVPACYGSYETAQTEAGEAVAVTDLWGSQ